MHDNSDLLDEQDFIVKENKDFRWSHFFIFYGIAFLETIALTYWMHHDIRHQGYELMVSMTFPIFISIIMFATYKGNHVGLKRKALLILLLMFSFIITLALLESIWPGFLKIKREDILIEIIIQLIYYCFEFAMCFGIEAMKARFIRRRLNIN